MPEDTYGEDRVTHGKSPLDDPAQLDLRRKERLEIESPAKQPPNRLTTIDKVNPPGGRPMANDLNDMRRQGGDNYDP